MSNSSLVDYIKLSPNCNSPRNHAIDTITIHHMAGNLSAETCGNVFAPKSRQASSNYGIDSNGRVGLYVNECDRSWCSSSSLNDNRAITIEVADDNNIGSSWHTSEKAYKKLIDLCADICIRNSINRLNYTGSKSGNLTMHKWFANTDCPGCYLENKFSEIANEVNAILKNNVIDNKVINSSFDNNNVNVTYAVQTSQSGWLPEVVNNKDYAGIKGEAITGVKIRVDKGNIKYRVHNLSGDWLPYVTGCDKTDSYNGYAGNENIIDAVQVIYYSTKLLKSAVYRVSGLNNSFMDYQWNNDTDHEQDGYAGKFGTKIDKFVINIQ